MPRFPRSKVIYFVRGGASNSFAPLGTKELVTLFYGAPGWLDCDNAPFEEVPSTTIERVHVLSFTVFVNSTDIRKQVFDLKNAMRARDVLVILIEDLFRLEETNNVEGSLSVFGSRNFLETQRSLFDFITNDLSILERDCVVVSSGLRSKAETTLCRTNHVPVSSWNVLLIEQLL